MRHKFDHAIGSDRRYVRERPDGRPAPAGLPEALPTPQDAPMSETLLDMKGMNCPLPVLRANRALRTMAPGERLRILATDRAAVADFQAFCRETGHALLAWSEEGGVFSFVIRRRPDDTEQKDE
jgi:tRNA 2-thiouridine synthesizing protein A